MHLKKEEISDFDFKTAFYTIVFLNFLGITKFYTGNFREGALRLCTLGGLGIFVLYDLYQLAMLRFRDEKGKIICPNYMKEEAGMLHKKGDTILQSDSITLYLKLKD